ncbi:MAG: hypothetical protein LQ345_001469 [Seirophora villosa]|nr:MAG: hypothetical protein LQ345_001469 [Seirophora villosa]
MSSPTNQSFLEAMALPALPLTVDRKKVEPEKVLIEKALDTFTAMLHALENHTRIEKPTSTSTAEENLGDYSQDPPEGSAGEVEHIEPVRLRERLVLRSGVPIPMKALRTLHECYKEAEIFINEDLVEHVETGKKLKKIEGKEADGYSEEDYILLRAALTELCQASMDGLINPEIRELELLEQFYAEQGAPNKAEALLLSRITRHSPIYIKGWFAFREKSLTAYEAIHRKMITKTNPNAAHDMAVLEAMYMMERDEKKPLWYH